MRRLAILFALLVAAAAATVGISGPAGAADNASVSVVHGIPKTPVDVFVNGKPTLKNFQPGKVAGPLSLPAGSYAVKVYAAGKDTGTPVISATAQVPAGANISLVAHLTADGKPTITPYVNDTSKIPAGMARLVVRHDAAAPAVDVRAGGKPVITGLTNPGSKALEVPAGSVSADVVLAGTSTVVIGPASLNLAAGSETVVYAVGSASAKTLTVVTQSMTGLGGPPTGMPAGSGGLLPDRDRLPAWGVGLVAGGALLALASAGRLVLVRRS